MYGIHNIVQNVATQYCIYWYRPGLVVGTTCSWCTLNLISCLCANYFYYCHRPPCKSLNPYIILYFEGLFVILYFRAKCSII